MRYFTLDELTDRHREIIESIIAGSESCPNDPNVSLISFKTLAFSDFEELYNSEYLDSSSRHDSSPSVGEIYDHFKGKEVQVILGGYIHNDGHSKGMYLDIDTICVVDPRIKDINFIALYHPDEFHIDETTKVMRGWWD